MRILVIGGTGVIGRPIVELLAKEPENEVFYVSRKAGRPIAGATHLVGSCMDDAFMANVLAKKDGRKYDCIIDLMWHTRETFLPRYERLLDSTDHYLVTSSGAVCADSNQPITEDMPRFIDVCSEEEREHSHQYHIEKARIEDILHRSKYRNWTILRPHVTYSSAHIPLFIWTKGSWFYRELSGHTIVLPKDSLDKRTVLTYSGDVARAVSMLIKNEKAYGEIIHVTSDQILERRTIVESYRKILEGSFHIPMKIHWLDSVEKLRRDFPSRADRMDNDRMLNRVYDNSKLKRITGGGIVFSDFYTCMKTCCETAAAQIDLNTLCYQDGVACAYMDRLTGEHTSPHDFGTKDRLLYLAGRATPSFAMLNRTVGLLKEAARRFS